MKTEITNDLSEAILLSHLDCFTLYYTEQWEPVAGAKRNNASRINRLIIACCLGTSHSGLAVFFFSERYREPEAVAQSAHKQSMK